MEIGFIGLGNLGVVMVDNLLNSGHKIHIYNRTPEKMEPYKEKAFLHTDLPSLAKACEVIISIVSDDKAVEAISLGKDGLVENMNVGCTHICLSTIAPATTVRLNDAHLEKNLEYVTATIIGRPEAAKARNLVICFSGTTNKKEAVFRVLKDLGGNRFFEFGDNPQKAAAVKICNNFLIMAAIESISESFNLVKQAGVDANDFYQMITETIFSSPIYKNYGKMIIEEAYDQKGGFTSQLGFKDIRLALGLAEQVAMPLPLADLIKNRFIVNHNRGRIDWDWTSIAQVIKEETREGN